MQDVPEVTINALSRAIELAIAPVFLLAGVAAFLNVLNLRLMRVVDRTRELDCDRPADLDAAELSVLMRRRYAINRAITLCTTCALLVCLVVLLMFLGIIVDIALAEIVAVLFISAMAALIVGLINFLREVRLAVRFLRRAATLPAALLLLGAASAHAQAELEHAVDRLQPREAVSLRVVQRELGEVVVNDRIR